MLMTLKHSKLEEGVCCSLDKKLIFCHYIFELYIKKTIYIESFIKIEYIDKKAIF